MTMYQLLKEMADLREAVNKINVAMLQLNDDIDKLNAIVHNSPQGSIFKLRSFKAHIPLEESTEFVVERITGGTKIILASTSIRTSSKDNFDFVRYAELVMESFCTSTEYSSLKFLNSTSYYMLWVIEDYDCGTCCN